MSDTTRLGDAGGVHMVPTGGLAAAAALPPVLNAIFLDPATLQLWRWDGAAFQQLSNTGTTGIAGLITVATAGGDYGTITDGLAAASSGDVVLVYPGTYAESVTIPAGVVLLGATVQVPTVISGADTTSTRVTLTGGGAPPALRNITVVGPSAGANPAVDASGLGAGSGVAAVFDVLLQGGGGTATGAGVLGAGTGQLIVQNLQSLSAAGVFGGPLVDMTAGTLVFTGMTLINGTATDIIRAAGTAVVRGTGITVSTGWVSPDGFDIGGTSDWQVDSMIVPEVGGQIDNVIHIVADGVTCDFSSAQAHGAVLDVLVDPALVGTGTTITWNAVDIRIERFSASTTWWAAASQVGIIVDTGINDDKASRSLGEYTVGMAEAGAEFAAGEGDSTTRNMLVYSEDPTNAFVDNTEAAASAAGSTFALLQGIAAANIAYFGNTIRAFPGMKTDTTVAMVVGAGVGVWEYGTGPGTWTAFDVMASDASNPYTQRAQNALVNTGGEQCRWDEASMTTAGWIATAVNGVTAFWVRFRLTTGVTSVPTLERIKLQTNHMEANADGFIEFFGKATVKRTFWQGNGEVVSAPSGGANAPANLDVTVSANISYRQEQSAYASGSDVRRAGTMIEIPDGLDTSHPIKLKAAWKVDGTNVGTVRWDAYVAQVKEGDVLGALTEVLVTQTPTTSGTAEEVFETEFEFNIPDVLPGDFFAFTLWRLGSTDTNTDTAGVLAMQWEGTFWQG